MNTVKERLKKKFSPEKADYSKAFENYNDKGFFNDIDYKSKERVAWQPLVHVLRMRDIAYGCMVDESCPFYGDENAKEKFLKLLEFYLEKHPVCTNWWYNDIKIPIEMFPVYLFAEELFNDRLKEKFLEFYVDKVDGNSAGANQVWLSEVLIYKAIITDDVALLKRGIGHIADEVYISEGFEQGIKPDFAFAQHRLQLYNNGYGKPFLENISCWIKLLRGTDFEFPIEKTQILIRLLVDGMLKMGRYKTHDFSTLGREFMNVDESEFDMYSYYSLSAKNLYPYANQDDKAAIDRYLARAEGKPYTKEDNCNRAYPSVAFMIHNREDFYSSLRFADKNIRGSECINGQNQIGGFQSFGCCTYMKTGEEYRGIYPVWDYGCIPGTTTPHTELSPVLENQDTEFARVLSDGKYGFGAADIIKTYKNSKVVVTPTGYLEKYVDENAEDIHFGGRKATFFFDRQVVHLGNSLYCDHTVNYHTTTDQCLLKGEVKVDGKILERSDELRETNAKCVTHNGFVYKILDNNTFAVKNGKQTGSRTRVEQTASTSAETVEKDVFTILIDHGVNVKNKSYEYIVFPNGETESAKVISNNDIQAVFCDNILCIAFYKAGTLEFNGKKITADKECLVMVKGNEILVDDKTAGAEIENKE